MINRTRLSWETPETADRVAYAKVTQLDQVEHEVRVLNDPSASPYAPKQLVVYTTAARPLAGGDWKYRTIIVRDPGSPSQVQVCVETSTNGAYEWIAYAQSS